VQEFNKCTHRSETEIIEELLLEAEEQPKHFGNGKDNLTVGEIKEKSLNGPITFYLSQKEEALRITVCHTFPPPSA
jgi:hypothetical protein